ncbi:MAG: hypothetical protein IPN86_23945 [Saprospiraceae bacterium]|nr:hypothetical protein [Saprospiraceae bacterium]
MINKNNIIVARLDINKLKWIETPSKKENSQIITNIDQNIHDIIGPIYSCHPDKYPEVVNVVQKGVSFAQLSVMNDLQNKKVQPDQDGNVSFYVPSNVDMSIAISDVCGNNLAESAIKVGRMSSNKCQILFLKNQDLLTVKSTMMHVVLHYQHLILVNVHFQALDKQ